MNDTRGYPEPVQRLIDCFAKLPGIGRRSAERLAFHVLKSEVDEARELAGAIGDVKTQVRHCAVCFNFADDERCAVCNDPRRERSSVLVVEQPKDALAIEQTGMYRGLYHVLLGRISPLDGVNAEDLTVADLLARLDDPERNAGEMRVEEVILGLNPTLEGDGTGLYLADQIERRGVRITQLARGLPSGATLEFASKAVLADAIAGRRAFDHQ
ncbi:MAG: recombination mediator RecR [Planctomycetota bacterium]